MLGGSDIDMKQLPITLCRFFFGTRTMRKQIAYGLEYLAKASKEKIIQLLSSQEDPPYGS
jgi:hypothetical protein